MINSHFSTPELVSKNEGAVTLQRTLVRNSLNEKYMFQAIDFWLFSIKNFYQRNHPNIQLSQESINIAKWYFNESKRYSYQAQNWRVDPKYLSLFQEFRSDRFYHLKNLVEVLMRELIEITLIAEGFTYVQVYRTSDSDDVAAGADLIVQLKKPDGIRQTFAIDFAVSCSKKYLEKKQERTYTRCREFNAYMGKDSDTPMIRAVLSIPPDVMGNYLIEYLKVVGQGIKLNDAQKLQMFELAQNQTVNHTHKHTKSKVNGIIGMSFPQ